MNELRSITDKKKKIGDYLKLGWIFDLWYEKIILTVLGILGLWKLINLFGFL